MPTAQEAITGAINPIQAQIEELRGSIPAQQNIDIDALRQSIIDELKTQTPAPGGGTGGGAGGEGGAGNTNVDGFSGTPYENFMGGFVPGAGQTYDAGMNYGPSASEAAGFNPAGGGNQSAYGQGGSQALLLRQRPLLAQGKYWLGKGLIHYNSRAISSSEI